MAMLLLMCLVLYGLRVEEDIRAKPKCGVLACCCGGCRRPAVHESFSRGAFGWRRAHTQRGLADLAADEPKKRAATPSRTCV